MLKSTWNEIILLALTQLIWYHLVYLQRGKIWLNWATQSSTHQLCSPPRFAIIILAKLGAVKNNLLAIGTPSQTRPSRSSCPEWASSECTTLPLLAPSCRVHQEQTGEKETNMIWKPWQFQTCKIFFETFMILPAYLNVIVLRLILYHKRLIKSSGYQNLIPLSKDLG